MDHNMVVSYGYCQKQNQRCDERTPPLQAILMAMWMRWSDARGIARFSKSRATLDAPGRRHRATTSSVSPQRPPGQQKTNNNQQMTLKRWLNWWPWRCAGTLPRTLPNGGGLGLYKMPLNTTIGQVLRPIMTIGHACAGFFYVFIVKTVEKGCRSTLRPLFSRGAITYQTKEKGLIKVRK